MSSIQFDGSVSIFLQGKHSLNQDLYAHPLLPTTNVDTTIAVQRKQVSIQWFIQSKCIDMNSKKQCVNCNEDYVYKIRERHINS